MLDPHERAEASAMRSNMGWRTAGTRRPRLSAVRAQAALASALAAHDDVPVLRGNARLTVRLVAAEHHGSRRTATPPVA
jgi:hypothetical protein